MKLPIAWLKEFVDVRWSPKELADRLTMAGFEVEADEINVTPNRGDCLSIVGLAREVSALKQRPLVLKLTPPPSGTGPIREKLKVQVLDRKGCPRYMARAISGVTIHPSPTGLQKRLEEAGIRPVNNVVDATNEIMLELGHPLHAFDYQELQGQQIIVQHAQTQTKFTTLDGETRVCEPNDLFIGDGAGPVALAGIMGGANSEISSKTKDIVIEAACFDPKTIHATAHRLKLATESSTRFERGVDPNGVANALHRVVQRIVELAGGTPTSDWVDIYPKKILPKQLTLTAAEVERHLGLKISPAEIAAILTALGFKPARRGNSWRVTIPTFRMDISRPIDLVEEVARIYGYDRIPETKPKIQVGVPEEVKGQRVLESTVQCLLGLGFTQGCHLSFNSREEAEPFADSPEKMVALGNPLSLEQSVLRPSLLPGLLKAAAFNAHRQCPSLKLFEIGKVFVWDHDQVKEERRLGLAAYGEEFPLHWQIKSKKIDFFTLKGVVTALAKLWRLEGLTFATDSLPAFLVPSQSAVIRCQQQKIGYLGLVNQGKVPVYVCELTIDKISEIFNNLNRKFKPISKFPFVERDLALVLERGISAGKIKVAIEQAKVPWVQDFQFFDLFTGGTLAPDQKSIALHIRYASPERTLTNEEVNQAHQSLVAHLEKTLPAKLRT